MKKEFFTQCDKHKLHKCIKHFLYLLGQQLKAQHEFFIKPNKNIACFDTREKEMDVKK